MKLIAHRGNTTGPNTERENNPEYLIHAVDKGYDCEVDVWVVNTINNVQEVWLGHDEPTYQVTKQFISNPAFWNHAKNLEALEFMLFNYIHCFWHEQDDYTITSKGYIWTYPGKPVCKKSVIVCKTLEDTMKYCKMDIAGVCSDYFGVFV